MTLQELAELKRLDAKRTKGEWVEGRFSEDNTRVYGVDAVIASCRLLFDDDDNDDNCLNFNHLNDAAYIAACSRLVPKMIDLVERLLMLVSAKDWCIKTLASRDNNDKRIRLHQCEKELPKYKKALELACADLPTTMTSRSLGLNCKQCGQATDMFKPINMEIDTSPDTYLEKAKKELD